MQGELVRSWVAIRVPGSVWPKLAEVQMTIRRKALASDLRWTTQEEALLTLASLGEQSWQALEEVAPKLEKLIALCPQVDVALVGLHGTPSNLQPRYVGVGIQGNLPLLHRLQAEIHKIVAMMVPPSEKDFLPQVVLGRLKVESEQARTALGRALRLIPEETLGEFTVTQVELVRSETSSSGIRYETVHAFPLSNARAAAPTG